MATLMQVVFDANVPVDQRAPLALFADGTGAPASSFPRTPTNANDPVSPQRDSANHGLIPPTVPAGVLHAFPDDPSLTPSYTPPGP